MKTITKERRNNKNWNHEITDEEILNREFSIGYLIQTNQHLPIFQDLKDKVLSDYKVRAKFEHLGYNGDSIYANGQKLVWRRNKFSDISVGKNVKLISHNFSSKGGGSNAYPAVGGKSCELEFISYGLPFVDNVNGWSIHIISLEKI